MTNVRRKLLVCRIENDQTTIFDSPYMCVHALRLVDINLEQSPRQPLEAEGVMLSWELDRLDFVQRKKKSDDRGSGGNSVKHSHGDLVIFEVF